MTITSAETNFNRRDLLAGLAAVPVAASTATSPAQARDEAYDFFAQRDHTGPKILAACELIRILALRDAPEGTHFRGAQFRAVGNVLSSESVWLSAFTADHQLIHMRPGVFDGWRAHGS